MKLFNHGNRCVNIIHCQLRNSASNLNADLHKDFIRDNCICDNCGFHTENAYHFFFECPQYSEERITLFNSISNMGMQKPISLDMILYGDSDISYVENITLFNIVHEYIVKTKRFKNN